MQTLWSSFYRGEGEKVKGVLIFSKYCQNETVKLALINTPPELKLLHETPGFERNTYLHNKFLLLQLILQT